MTPCAHISEGWGFGDREHMDGLVRKLFEADMREALAKDSPQDLEKFNKAVADGSFFMNLKNNKIQALEEIVTPKDDDEDKS